MCSPSQGYHQSNLECDDDGPKTWALQEIFQLGGKEYQTGTRTDTFIIATRVGAERDKHLEVVDVGDIIKIDRRVL